MPRFMRSYGFDERSESGSGGLNELFFLERSIDRRLAIFLIAFAVIVVGALSSGSSAISSAGFSIGSIICWLLALSIILTTRKAGAVAGEIKNNGSSNIGRIERKLYSKIIRWILGYIIPVFCAVVLTFGSVASSVGWLDNVWFYKYKIESKVDEVKNNLPEIKIQKAQEKTPIRDNHFTPIDSVIYVPVVKKQAPKAITQLPNTNFKRIDSQKVNQPVKENKPVKKVIPPDKNFKPIESIAK